MLGDSAFQILLSLFALGVGVYLWTILRRASRHREQTGSRWGCVWSCILAALFFFFNRCIVVIQVLTPTLHTECCEPIEVLGDSEKRRYHVLRSSSMVLLYLGVICSVLAIHAVAYVFVSQAMRIRDQTREVEIFRRFLQVSPWLYVAFCIGMYTINNSYNGAIGVIYALSISVMFFYGERVISKALNPIVRGQFVPDSQASSRNLEQSRILLSRIKWTTYGIYLASLLLFIASALYLGMNVAKGGWRGTTPPGQVSASAIGNNWISGSMIFYVFAVEWFLLQVFNDSLRSAMRAERAPPLPSLSGSSSTSQDSTMVLSSQRLAAELPVEDRVERGGQGGGRTSTTSSGPEVPQSHTASSSTSQGSATKDSTQKESNVAVT